MILSQEDTVCFQIVEEDKTKYNNYGDIRKAWMKTTESPKKILQKKSNMCKLDDATKNPEEWITKLKLTRGYLQKNDVQIDNS